MRRNASIILARFGVSTVAIALALGLELVRRPVDKTEAAKSLEQSDFSTAESFLFDLELVTRDASAAEEKTGACRCE